MYVYVCTKVLNNVHIGKLFDLVPHMYFMYLSINCYLVDWL